MKRLFVAVPVSEKIKDGMKPVLEALSETGADLKLVSLSNLHLTLKFLGEVSEEKIPEIVEKLKGIAGKTSAFELKIAKIGVFPSLDRINVIWAGIEDPSLLSLMREVNKELDYLRKDEHENEMPHLTLARVKSARNKKELQEFVKKNEDKEFGTMMVDKIILSESELTREGPVYRAVGEFRLKE